METRVIPGPAPRKFYPVDAAGASKPGKKAQKSPKFRHTFPAKLLIVQCQGTISRVLNMTVPFRSTLQAAVIALLLVFAGPARALEERTTTAELAREAPYVALVRVEGARTLPGPFPIQNIEVALLENLKGKLPLSFDVRIILNQNYARPGGSRPPSPGDLWILILGEKNAEGIYPLRSMHWGRIEVIEHPQTGEYLLARPVTGFSSQSAERVSLEEFRVLLKNLLAKQGSGK